jgi:hypothetical protein
MAHHAANAPAAAGESSTPAVDLGSLPALVQAALARRQQVAVVWQGQVVGYLLPAAPKQSKEARRAMADLEAHIAAARAAGQFDEEEWARSFDLSRTTG